MPSGAPHGYQFIMEEELDGGIAINGGFGMVLDGSIESEKRLEGMLFWDVNNGIARRNWAGNKGAIFTIEREMDRFPDLHVTVPNLADDKLLESALDNT